MTREEELEAEVSFLKGQVAGLRGPGGGDSPVLSVLRNVLPISKQLAAELARRVITADYECRLCGQSLGEHEDQCLLARASAAGLLP